MKNGLLSQSMKYLFDKRIKRAYTKTQLIDRQPKTCSGQINVTAKPEHTLLSRNLQYVFSRLAPGQKISTGPVEAAVKVTRRLTAGTHPDRFQLSWSCKTANNIITETRRCSASHMAERQH